MANRKSTERQTSIYKTNKITSWKCKGLDGRSTTLFTSGPINHPNIIDMRSYPHSHLRDKIPQTSNQDQWLHRSISFICPCFPSPNKSGGNDTEETCYKWLEISTNLSWKYIDELQRHYIPNRIYISNYTTNKEIIVIKCINGSQWTLNVEILSVYLSSSCLQLKYLLPTYCWLDILW